MATAMVMVMITHMTPQIIDIHTHLMYDFDDGSKNINMTNKLLKRSCSQGVKVIFLTPHIKSQLNDIKIKELNDKFIKISQAANQLGIECFLGAELYISFRIPEIDFKKHVMGNSNGLLIEFSTFLETPIVEHSYNLIKRGFKVIIAHVERYEYLQMNDIFELKKMGVLLQVNASSLIKKGRSKHLRRAWDYLRNDLIDFIASDCHNLISRPPNLEKAYKILNKKIGFQKTNDLFFNNAKKILID